MYIPMLYVNCNMITAADMIFYNMYFIIDTL